MMRRMTLLRRRPDISREAFSAQWAGPHAVIAKAYRGLAKYTQNHVVERLDDAPRDTFGADGMAELWFENAGALTAALGSDVADRLIEDEPRFLDGVTGMILDEADLDDGTGGIKVIVLGRRRPGARVVAAPPEAATYNSAAGVSSTYGREKLWSVPVPPDTVLVARFADLAAAREVIAQRAWPAMLGFDAWHAYHVREVRVV
jgi:uncharacterized protein (TIGR02118 family)